MAWLFYLPVNWPYKFVGNGAGAKKEELYDLSRDPGEKKNIAATAPDIAKAMREALHGYLDTTSLDYRPATAAPPEP